MYTTTYYTQRKIDHSQVVNNPIRCQHCICPVQNSLKSLTEIEIDIEINVVKMKTKKVVNMILTDVRNRHFSLCLPLSLFVYVRLLCQQFEDSFSFLEKKKNTSR